MSNEKKSEDTFKAWTDGLMEGFSQLSRKVGTFMDDMFQGEGDISEFPVHADLYVDGDQLVFEFELPGVKKEDTHLYIHEGVLTVKGVKQIPAGTEDLTFLKRERKYGTFMRSFPLPPEAATDNIKAKYEAGVLTARLPWKGQTSKEEKNVDIE